MSRSYWSWTLIVEVKRQRQAIPGRTEAGPDATADSILPGIIADFARQVPRGVQFTVASFEATRIA